MLCSTTHIYHYLRHTDPEVVEAIVRDGLRPLSEMPGVFFTNVDLRRVNGRGFANGWRFQPGSVPIRASDVEPPV
jgi:hypothetical protein